MITPADTGQAADAGKPTPADAGAPVARLQATIRHLAAIDRPSGSEGEREAAVWIAQQLREAGCDARLETESAHGTYWWPLGLLAGLAGAASLSNRRKLAFAAGAFAAAAIADDITGGRQWFRRRFLSVGPTYNVVAEAGDASADRAVVLVAHHDAAHWSLIFHPALPPLVGDRWPQVIQRTDTTLPVMWPVIGGPLLVALGALTGRRVLRRAGTLVSLGTAATMAEIGSRSAVPGANDNLTGVATLLEVARALRDEPLTGLRVLLVSTGSEESLMEGMQAFARRHFPQLPVDRTRFICVDTVGSPELIQLEGEGMLRMADYDAAFKDFVSECATQAGVHLRRGLRFRNSTDALIAHKHGYPTVMLGSVNRYKLPDNYHWPTDDADHVRYETVADTVRLCVAVVRRLGRG